MSSKELLTEYGKLNSKIKHINETLQEMNAIDIAQLIDKIRLVERKMGLVYTLFRSSVYYVTQQSQEDEEEEQDEQAQEQEQEQEQEPIADNARYSEDRRPSRSQERSQEPQQSLYQQYSDQESPSNPSQSQPSSSQQGYRPSLLPMRRPLYYNDSGNGLDYRNTNRPALRMSLSRRATLRGST
ncbi:DASH complex subunit Dad3-domain-containing protein [Mortierella sp. GBAus27b]|nr:hypothetical protein BGX31_000681 [Mortierella sp. GBA43]KAI8351283.1 DASH complex subunit Dad3-domain-containing protein [Mortierella sp. GBAus27b]